MNLSPLQSGFSNAKSNLSYLGREIGLFFGYIWKTTSQVPTHLCHLIMTVKDFVKKYFFGMSALVDGNSKKSSKLNHDKLKNSLCKKEKETEIDSLKESNSSPKKDAKPAEKTIQGGQNSFNLEEDPLKGLGDFAPHLLNEKMQGYQKLPEIGIKELDKEIFDTVEGIVKPGQNLLQDIEKKKLDTWQEYLIAIEEIENVLTALNVYNSKFENLPRAHALVKTTLKNLADKTSALEEEMCAKMKEKYKPNPKIGIKGDCLFESIEDNLKSKKIPKYYRELAADHIRKNAEKFKTGVLDAMATKQGKSRIHAYLQDQKGVKVWKKKMEGKIGKEPTKIDLYCDCLENSNLWGGTNEIFALSMILEVPIIVFTRQNALKWRLDVKEGQSSLKNKAPILLYYNGESHYQNLIPR